MNDRQIECFIRTAENLNFTDTAKDMFTTQPTVSRLINGLEEELGFPLFYRDRKEVRLTPSGSLIYNFFEHSNTEFEECIDKAKNIDQGYEGVINMGLSSSMEMDVMWDDIIPKFQKMYPSIRFTYECTPTAKELTRNLTSEKYDVVINLTGQEPDTKLFQSMDVLHSNMYLACGKSHPLARCGFLDPAVLERSTIWTVFPEEWQNELIRGLYRHLGINKWRVQRVNNVDTLLINVRMGNGIFFADPVTKKLNSSNYVVYPLPEQFSGVTISAIWKKKNASPSLMLFLEYLRQRQSKNE